MQIMAIGRHSNSVVLNDSDTGNYLHPHIHQSCLIRWMGWSYSTFISSTSPKQKSQLIVSYEMCINLKIIPNKFSPIWKLITLLEHNEMKETIKSWPISQDLCLLKEPIVFGPSATNVGSEARQKKKGFCLFVGFANNKKHKLHLKSWPGGFYLHPNPTKQSSVIVLDLVNRGPSSGKHI